MSIVQCPVWTYLYTPPTSKMSKLKAAMFSSEHYLPHTVGKSQVTNCISAGETFFKIIQ